MAMAIIRVLVDVEKQVEELPRGPTLADFLLRGTQMA